MANGSLSIIRILSVVRGSHHQPPNSQRLLPVIRIHPMVNGSLPIIRIQSVAELPIPVIRILSVGRLNDYFITSS
jgi:hypothetical protein